MFEFKTPLTWTQHLRFLPPPLSPRPLYFCWWSYLGHFAIAFIARPYVIDVSDGGKESVLRQFSTVSTSDIRLFFLEGFLSCVFLFALFSGRPLEAVEWTLVRLHRNFGKRLFFSNIIFFYFVKYRKRVMVIMEERDKSRVCSFLCLFGMVS